MKLIDINSRFITGTGLLLFVLLISQNILAQSTLHGAVTTVHNKAIPNANVLLLKAADSSLVKDMVTNETGLYTFSNVTKGKYIISITFSGYKTGLYSPP